MLGSWPAEEIHEHFLVHKPDCEEYPIRQVPNSNEVTNVEHALKRGDMDDVEEQRLVEEVVDKLQGWDPAWTWMLERVCLVYREAL